MSLRKGQAPNNLETLIEAGKTTRFRKGQFAGERHPNWKGGITPVRSGKHRSPVSREPNALITCGCGCEQSLMKFDRRHRERRFISGHNPIPSESLKGKAAWNKGLIGYKAGRKHHNWKGGITPQNQSERVQFRMKMQPLIFLRDNYTCQICGAEGGDLQVDHIKRWSDYPELRFDPDNCRTLCMACHYYVTFKRKLPHGVVWGHNLSRRIA